MDDKKRTEICYNGIGQSYIQQNNRKEGRLWIEKALALGKKIGRVIAIRDNYRVLSEIDSIDGHYKSAYEHYRMYVFYKDSMDNEQTSRKVNELQMQYKFDKQQDSIAAAHQQEKIIQDSVLHNTKKNRNMLIAALLGVFLFSGTVYYYRNQHKGILFEKKLTETELNLFRLQMNPHFMFNALNSIYSYVIVNERDNAARYLKKFSKLMRTILENSSKNFVTLADDLKALDLYLELEAERMNHKFSYHIDIEKGLDPEKIMVPPMILQPFLENSVWHGMLDKEKDGMVQLHVGRNGELLQCTITDNGNGFRKGQDQMVDDKRSYGISITRQRIENLNKTHKVKGYCDVKEILDDANRPAGVRVEVGLPLELEA